MKRYLIDASFLFSLINTKDKHHSACKEFSKKHSKDEWFLSALCLFEVDASRQRRLREHTFLGQSGELTLKRCIPIDRKFYKDCQKEKLFDTFKELRGADLTYACMAKMNNLILVTCDNHFDLYKKEIGLRKL